VLLQIHAMVLQQLFQMSTITQTQREWPGMGLGGEGGVTLAAPMLGLSVSGFFIMDGCYDMLCSLGTKLTARHDWWTFSGTRQMVRFSGVSKHQHRPSSHGFETSL
jgi:hypothetical protein